MLSLYFYLETENDRVLKFHMYDFSYFETNASFFEKQSFAEFSLKILQISPENTRIGVFFNKSRLQHSCCPVKLAKFLRTPISQNTFGGCFCSSNHRRPVSNKHHT